MKKLFLFFILSSIAASSLQAQFTRYVVKLKNKGGTPFTLANPSTYLSQRAIDRRIRYGIAIDSTDLPVTPSYITQIDNVPNVSILNVSKWLNSVSILTTDANAITTINALPFVQNVTGVAARGTPIPASFDESAPELWGKKYEQWGNESIPLAARTEQVSADFYNYGASSFNEINLHSGQFLHNIGLRGQGMQIAMLDGGFLNYHMYRAFDSANLNGQVLSTWDFVNQETSVREDDSHGMSCMSTIVANIPGQFIGKAPKASFHLFRTEDVFSEHRIEEHNWACGAERADSSGADVISTSLGYYIQFTPPSQDHPNSDMDGNTTMAAIAGDLAAKKGVLVFASIGNDGNNPTATHFLSSASDGDSVLAVGAVNAAGALGSFSSYGPSFDGQVKPDLASVGVSAVVQTGGGTIGTSNGTSFACPNMAGLGTILWQGFPEFNNMKIRDALWRSGNRFGSPDNRLGYGVPNLKLAFSQLLVEFATSSSSSNNCAITINWTSKDASRMKYEIERKGPAETGYTKIGELNALSTLFTKQTYQFVNNIPGGSAGTYSYRIRQIIDPETATFTALYIDTTSIAITPACIATSVDVLRVTPNPTQADATLHVFTTDAIANMPIVVFDMHGRMIWKVNTSKTPGEILITLPMQRFAGGKYIVKAYNGTKELGTTEFLKQ